MPEYLDLSHRIENGMTFFPGDPEPRINAATATGPWRVSELEIGTHTGTHIDAASHFYPDGKTIDQYAVGRFIVPAAVAMALDLGENEAIEPSLLADALTRVPKGGGLLIRTDWDEYWGTDSYMRHPYITPQAADAIVDAGIDLVGIDALNVDSTVDGSDRVHEILLGSDVLIVENLRGLIQLEPSTVYQLSVLPLLLPGLDGSPIRAVAWEK